MAADSTNDAPAQRWDDWPPETILGNCKIRVHHSDESPRKAFEVIAEPQDPKRDFGALIHCYLPVTDRCCVAIRPPFSAYWSSRRRSSQTSEYFNEYLPNMDIAVAQAMRSKRFADRELAAIYLVFGSTPYQIQNSPGETSYSIAKDEIRFNEIAREWLATRTTTPEGARNIAIAQDKVEKAAGWFAELENFDPSGSEPVKAKLTQCATYRAICDATLKFQGIPTLKQVREAFHNVAIQWEQMRAIRGGQKTEIRIKGFDQAIKNLGFSWLPRSL